MDEMSKAPWIFSQLPPRADRQCLAHLGKPLGLGEIEAVAIQTWRIRGRKAKGLTLGLFSIEISPEMGDSTR